MRALNTSLVISILNFVAWKESYDVTVDNFVSIIFARILSAASGLNLL